MDSDLSHSPSDVLRLLAASGDKDVVVGSRFVNANSLEGWALSRKLMTHLGHILTAVFLRLSQDCTNAFRFYRLDRIPVELFEMVQSNGYSFFFESLHRIDVNGFRISEIAINLPARTYGHSKMRFKDVMHSVLFLLQLGWRAQFRRASLIYVAPFANRDTSDNARLELRRAPVDQKMYVRRSV
jgi:dolichol-phosphate mannosyltransferase